MSSKQLSSYSWIAAIVGMCLYLYTVFVTWNNKASEGLNWRAHLDGDAGRLGEVPEGHAEQTHEGRLCLVRLRAARA